MSELKFAERLKHLLDTGGHKYDRAVSQAELSKAVGITRQAISSYLNDATLPTIDKLNMIADYFDVTSDYLIGRSESMRPENQSISDEIGINDEAINILRWLKRDRDRFMDYPEFLRLLMVRSPIGSIEKHISQVYQEQKELKDIISSEMDKLTNRKKGDKDGDD